MLYFNDDFNMEILQFIKQSTGTLQEIGLLKMNSSKVGKYFYSFVDENTGFMIELENQSLNLVISEGELNIDLGTSFFLSVQNPKIQLTIYHGKKGTYTPTLEIYLLKMTLEEYINTFKDILKEIEERLERQKLIRG